MEERFISLATERRRARVRACALAGAMALLLPLSAAAQGQLSALRNGAALERGASRLASALGRAGASEAGPALLARVRGEQTLWGDADVQALVAATLRREIDVRAIGLDPDVAAVLDHLQHLAATQGIELGGVLAIAPGGGQGAAYRLTQCDVGSGPVELAMLEGAAAFLHGPPAATPPHAVRGQVEVFGLRALARGQIPDIPDGIDKLFVPNFEQSRSEDIRAAIINLQDAYPDKSVVPYLPVRKYTPAEADELLRFFRERGVDELVVLAGGKFADAEARGAFTDTHSFLEQVDVGSYGIRAIGVAAHPEHHFLMTRSERMDVLKRKVELARAQGLEISLLTNIVSNPRTFARWQREVRENGVDCKIFYGLALPGMTVAEFSRFTVDMCQAITTVPHHPDYDAEAIARLASPASNSLPQVHADIAALGIEVDGFHFYLYGKERAGGLRTLRDWLGPTPPPRP